MSLNDFDSIYSCNNNKDPSSKSGSLSGSGLASSWIGRTGNSHPSSPNDINNSRNNVLPHSSHGSLLNLSELLSKGKEPMNNQLLETSQQEQTYSRIGFRTANKEASYSNDDQNLGNFVKNVENLTISTPSLLSTSLLTTANEMYSTTITTKASTLALTPTTAAAITTTTSPVFPLNNCGDFGGCYKSDISSDSLKSYLNGNSFTRRALNNLDNHGDQSHQQQHRHSIDSQLGMGNEHSAGKSIGGILSKSQFEQISMPSPINQGGQNISDGNFDGLSTSNSRRFFPHLKSPTNSWW